MPRKPTRAKQLGVTDAEYERLLAAQGGHCALCPNVPKTRRLHVDHDHATGLVRGLLCHRCNRALPTWVGMTWLLDAAAYIAHMTHTVDVDGAGWLHHRLDPTDETPALMIGRDAVR